MVRDREYFSEWDLYGSRWVQPNIDDGRFPGSPRSNSTQSVADWVLEMFGLGSCGLGSQLPGYDIKYRDAYDMIQLSLAYELTNGQLVECYANEEGSGQCYSIGGDPGRIISLYEIESVVKIKDVNNVMVIGYDPPPTRVVGQEYDLFQFASLFPNFNADDPDLENYPKIHAWAKTLEPEACNYAKEGYIEYGDPHFDQDAALVEADVIHPPYDTILTYIYKVEIPWFQPGSTRVEFANKTPRYEKIYGMGELAPRQWNDNPYYVSEFCSSDTPLTSAQIAQYGVQLTDSDNKKFLGVREVYIYGYRIKRISLDYYSTDDSDERIENKNSDFLIDVDTTLKEPFKLSRGDDYIIAKDGDYFKIIFPSNVRPDYVDIFSKTGGTVPGAGAAKVRISPSSIIDASTGSPVNTIDIFNPNIPANGVLRDGVTLATNAPFAELVNIFPIGEGQAGYVVDYVVVVYDWDNPCVALYDEDNLVTVDNLNAVSVHFYPIIMNDLRAPVAYNGKLLDPADEVADYDPDTVQDLENTEYTLAFQSLQGGDIKLTLPFLDPQQALQAGETIRSLSTAHDNDRQRTVTCAPGSTPQLGGLYDGKIINSIDYSYQDSSQYLISVQLGPMWLGMSGWDTVTYQNKTERIQLEGTVVGRDASNHWVQVDVDKIGFMECINGTRDIIEVGDKVIVTIYNNPISI